MRAAAIEHGTVLLVDDLDAQPFLGDVQHQLFLELLEQRVGVDGFFQLFLQTFKLDRPPCRFEFGLGGLQIDGFFLGGLGRPFLTWPFLAGHIRAAALDHAGCIATAGASLHGHFERRLEILGDALQGRLWPSNPATTSAGRKPSSRSRSRRRRFSTRRRGGHGHPS